MKQILTLVVAIFAFSALASAQAPTPTGKMPSQSDSSGGKNELFGAFLYEPTDWWCYTCVGAHGLSAKGVEFSYTRYFGDFIGAVADMDYAKNSDQIELSNFGYRFGVRGNLLRRERMIVPFGHILVGGGHASYY